MTAALMCLSVKKKVYRSNNGEEENEFLNNSLWTVVHMCE